MADSNEMSENDKAFFARTDALIDLANKQMEGGVTPGDVSASFMYAVARFNAHITAADFPDSASFKGEKEKVVDYFVDQYRLMLESHVEDYVVNFNTYLPR